MTLGFTPDPERRDARRERQYGPDERRAWVTGLICSTCGGDPPSQQSHSRSRGAGGRAEDILAQCWRCHRELHDRGWRTYERRTGLDLRGLARLTERVWQICRGLPVQVRGHRRGVVGVRGSQVLVQGADLEVLAVDEGELVAVGEV